MGLFKKVFGRREHEELFNIPESGVVEQAEPVPGKPYDPTAPPPEAAGSPFEQGMAEQMVAQGMSADIAEFTADKVEDAMKKAFGGQVPATAQWSVQAGNSPAAPFQVPGAGGGAGAAKAEAEDPLDQIAKLAELRDKKVLTEAEFQAEKAKLLGETT
jgi:hypothetical protein